MPRFSRPMERRLRGLEREYEMSPREEEEEGIFGPRGFWGNIRDYYGWGDWWRGLFGRERTGGRARRPESYTIYPEWGEENIRTLREIMKETQK